MAHIKKVVFVGDGGVGKTTYMRRMLVGDYTEKYIPTLGVEVHPLDYTDTGYKYNVWDTAGQERYGGLRDGYWLKADYFVIFYDGKLSQKNALGKWTKDVKRFGDVKILYVCTKCDLNHKFRIPSDHIKISSKTSCNLDAVFEALSNNIN